MFLKFLIPALHAVDLVLICFLTRALGQVTLGPLSVAGGDLLNADHRVLAVVPIFEVVRSSFSSGATVWKLVCIVMATSLVTTVKVALHTSGVSGELGSPS